MKKLLILLLVLMTTTAFSQNVERLNKLYKAEIGQSLGTMGLSLFAYGLGTSAYFEKRNDDNPNTAAFLGGVFGVTLNIVAIHHFVKARRLKKQIKSFEL